MHPMIFNPYYDLIIIKREIFNKDNFIKKEFPKLDFDGSLKLRLSLFDYLTRILGCSTYVRENDCIDNTYSDDDDEYKTIWRMSRGEENEMKLWFLLYNIDIDITKAEYIENLRNQL
jgi:hypothetical protein